jgi:hypothetical protein
MENRAGSVRIQCPWCRALLDIPVVIGEVTLGLAEAGKMRPLVMDVAPDHDALHAHIAVCPGPPDGGGEELPEAANA